MRVFKDLTNSVGNGSQDLRYSAIFLVIKASEGLLMILKELIGCILGREESVVSF